MNSTAGAVDLATAREMARRILQVAGDRVRRIILYGSRARGTAKPWSDFDLLVVEADPVEEIEEEERLTAVLRELGVAVEVRVVGEEAFAETYDLVGYLAYFACYDGVTLYDEQGTTTSRRGSTVGRHSGG